MKRFFKLIGLLAIVALLFGTVYFLYQKSIPVPVVYETVELATKDIQKKTLATGKIVPRREVNVKPEINGIIDEIYVEPGQMVEAGDLIARVRVIVDAQSLSNAKSRVNSSRILLQDAQTEYNRQKNLFDKGVIAESEYQRVKVSQQKAEEDFAAAEDYLEIIEKGVAKRSGKTTNTLIRASARGMIIDIPVEEGNSVIMSNNFNDGTTVAIIANMKDLIFEGKVDETEVGRIKEGTPITIKIGAIGDLDFPATLSYVSPKGVDENGAVMFEVKADLNLQEDQFVRAGYSANAEIVLEEKRQVPSLPESVIIFDRDSTFVEVEISEQTFERRPVELGISDGVNVEILSELANDTKVKGAKK